MDRCNARRSLLTLISLFAAAGVVGPAAADDADSSEYTLRYRFKKGEEVRMVVTHEAATDTRIRGSNQTSHSRSVSTKLWRIKSVDAQQNTTFEHLVTHIDMWQKSSGRPEVRYVSSQDKAEEAPSEYKVAASIIGKVLAEVKISPAGVILERKSNVPEFDMGLGPIATPLPTEPIKIGGTWNHPDEIRVRLSDGATKRIKIRNHFKLARVNGELATITVKTEVLTPVDNPEIEAQLVQQLTNGEITFDIAEGRVTHREMKWDESVVGFQGAESMMKYTGRYNEESAASVALRLEGPKKK